MRDLTNGNSMIPIRFRELSKLFLQRKKFTLGSPKIYVEDRRLFIYDGDFLELFRKGDEVPCDVFPFMDVQLWESGDYNLVDKDIYCSIENKFSSGYINNLPENSSVIPLQLLGNGLLKILAIVGNEQKVEGFMSLSLYMLIAKGIDITLFGEDLKKYKANLGLSRCSIGMGSLQNFADSLSIFNANLDIEYARMVKDRYGNLVELSWNKSIAILDFNDIKRIGIYHLNQPSYMFNTVIAGNLHNLSPISIGELQEIATTGILTTLKNWDEKSDVRGLLFRDVVISQSQFNSSFGDDMFDLIEYQEVMNIFIVPDDIAQQSLLEIILYDKAIKVYTSNAGIMSTGAYRLTISYGSVVDGTQDEKIQGIEIDSNNTVVPNSGIDKTVLDIFQRCVDKLNIYFT